ncbi:M50 family metallopeptidase [Hymenobacter metallicola]|uniref:M50 family peptidase n=1 Tax=Hymenobacter metallicola TaxID=2563114 RepID=A0A4Z0QDI6_9BACT|nr:M50 family metallopeptidase [Hymenobacter metallicola]TGE28110.1 M50 family peptidase [Hymenobacter metallicola]
MKTLFRFIVAALLFLLSVGVGRVARSYAATPGKWPLWQVGLVLLLLPLAWMLAVLVHELGHSLAGRWQGFRFQWLVVGPCKWQQIKGRLHFCWNTNLGMAGGMTLSVPLDGHDLRRRYIIYSAAGPLASLMWAVLALGIQALLPASVQTQPSSIGLAMSGAVSLLLACFTLVPVHSAGVASDGAKVLKLWRNTPAGQLEITLLSVVGRSVAGVRPRELPLADLEAAASLPFSLSAKLYVYHYLYLAALDKGLVAKAGYYLSACRQDIAQIPVAMHSAIWLESAFFAAAYEHDLSAARAFLARASQSSLTPADVLPRVAAAQARLVGDAPSASIQAQLALRQLHYNIDKGSCRFYADWLNGTVQWAAHLQHSNSQIKKNEAVPH